MHAKASKRNSHEILMAIGKMEDAKQNRLLNKRGSNRKANTHKSAKGKMQKKTEKQISDKIGKLLTFPINIGSFITKRVI